MRRGKMKRREFLKMLGVAPAVTVLPALAKTAKSDRVYKLAESPGINPALKIHDDWFDALKYNVASKEDCFANTLWPRVNKIYGEKYASFAEDCNQAIKKIGKVAKKGYGDIYGV